MNERITKPPVRKLVNAACIAASLAALLAASAVAPAPGATRASSHREAPLISNDAQADATDTYVFISPDRQDSVTLVGSFVPLESPEGGPNYYSFGDDVVYDLNIDNDGDANPNVTYRFTFKTITTNPNTFLYNTGPITKVNPPTPAWNIRQYYTVTEIISNTSLATPTETTLFGNKLVPPVNIGDKSTPNFNALSDEGIYTTGAGNAEVKVFAGQTDDPFWVDLGSVFDLLTLRGQAAPIGYGSPKGPSPGLDGVAGYNVHSLVIQVPITRALTGATAGESVIGVWTASSRYSMRTLNGPGGLINGTGLVSNTGTLVQVSRLGMPLVNEVVLPLALKDAFNAIPPSVDYPLATGVITPLAGAGQLLLQSVLTPELQTLLKNLYGVPNPGKPRTDIFDIFLSGMVTAKPFPIITAGGVVTLTAPFTVTRPKNGVPAEMLRLNTAIKGNLCKPVPDYQLGLLGGDACGFPNGRRLQDDVTEIELLAVAGAAWPALTSDTSFTFSSTLISVLTDSVDKNDKPFRSTFPYLAYAHQGQEHQHPYIMRWDLPLIFRQ